jgi:hypothetical protein
MPLSCLVSTLLRLLIVHLSTHCSAFTSTVKKFSGLLRGCDKLLIKVYSLLPGNAGEIFRKERIGRCVVLLIKLWVCQIQGTAVHSLPLALEE